MGTAEGEGWGGGGEVWIGQTCTCHSWYIACVYHFNVYFMHVSSLKKKK